MVASKPKSNPQFDTLNLYAALPGVQCPGVLDNVFFFEGPLGACLGSDSITISLWAPTAQQVTSKSPQET